MFREPARSILPYDQITSAEANLSGKRLLILAANQTERKYLSLQAKSWDIEVSAVASAEAALSRLAEDKFDAIVIDETGLTLDCVYLALQIRNLKNYQNTSLVLLRGQRKSSTDPLNELNICTKLLRKPVRRSHFFEALAQLLLNRYCSIDDSDFDGGCSSERPDRDKKGNKKERARQAHSQSIGTETPKDHKPLKILLTEDIALNQKVALHMLASYQYQADIANNGAEAVAALKREQYDLVLMDVQMPVMDGLEATRKIRSDPRISQPHIVAMTAHAMQGDREECISAGMDDYIRKPIGKRDLLSVLQQCKKA